MKYLGHKNWNHWNVCLWLMNDEHLYSQLLFACRTSANLDQATRILIGLLPRATPDGACYSKSAIRAALRGCKVGRK